MVAVGVLSTVLVFIIACFTNLLASTQKGEDLTVATYLAESQIEQLKANPSYLAQALQNGALTTAYSGRAEAMGSSLYSSMGSEVGSGATNLGGSRFLNKVVYNYWVTASKYCVQGPPALCGGCCTASTPLQNLYVVDVEIFWFGDTAQRASGILNRTGSGQLRTHITRAFYLHN